MSGVGIPALQWPFHWSLQINRGCAPCALQLQCHCSGTAVPRSSAELQCSGAHPSSPAVTADSWRLRVSRVTCTQQINDKQCTLYIWCNTVALTVTHSYACSLRLRPHTPQIVCKRWFWDEAEHWHWVTLTQTVSQTNSELRQCHNWVNITNWWW